jgi:hypothetical protein
MSFSLILLLGLIVLAFAMVPAWPHSRSWGWAPLGTASVALLVVIVLMMIGTL